MASTTERWTNCLQIIADETGVDVNEINDHDEFSTDLGVNAPLSKSITARLQYIVPDVPEAVLNQYPTIGALRDHLQRLPNGTEQQHDLGDTLPARSRVPLSTVLQRNPATCTTTVFLLPDGSGSGMAYARIPPISSNTCLVALNSPFLRSPAVYTCAIEDMARHWTKEIRRRQANGPYLLGGWSAGGYYAYEVTRELERQGERVSKLILLDSPVRPEFEELPIEVVEHLSAQNLMGNWGASKQPPTAVVEHFRSTLRAVRQYVPTPVAAPPAAYLIWSADGVMDEDELDKTGLDLRVKVTHFLLAGKPNFGPHGWERLFPGGKLYTSKISGNHFTLISPPQVNELGPLLRDVVSDELGDRWTGFPGAKR